MTPDAFASVCGPDNAVQHTRGRHNSRPHKHQRKGFINQKNECLWKMSLTTKVNQAERLNCVKAVEVMDTPPWANVKLSVKLTTLMNG